MKAAKLHASRALQRCYDKRCLRPGHRVSSSRWNSSSVEHGTIGDRVRLHLREQANNETVTSLKRQRDLLKSKQLTQEEISSLVETWAEDWKRLGNTKQSSKEQEIQMPLMPQEMVATITAQSDGLVTSMPVLVNLIDGIVAAGKVQRKAIGFADLAVEYCLDPMTMLCRVSQQDMEVFVHSVNKVMNLYCREKKVRMAEGLLDRLEETINEVEQNGHSCLRYNLVSSGTYAIVIAGYAKAGMPREAEHILFARMIQQRKLMPRKDLFDACLTAWEIAGTKDAGHRAEFLLLRHQQWHEAHPDVIAPPDAKTMAKAANAWVNSKHPDAPSHIGKVLDTMYAVEFTDVTIFTNAHLQEMKIWAWRGNPNQCRESMQRLIAHFGKARVPPIKLQRMYATWITAHVRSRNLRQKQLKHIIDELATEQQQGTFGEIKFWDRSLYVAMFEALSKVGDGAGAEHLLESLHGKEDAPEPNLKMYNSVLLAWSKSKDDNAFERAEQLFQRILVHGTVKADVVTYNAILAAMARAKEKTISLAIRGEKYLRQMRAAGIAATAVTYNQAILLWWRIPESEPIQKIEILLQEMSARRIAPDTLTFKACLSVVDTCRIPIEQKQMLLKYYRDEMARAAG